MSTVSLEEAQTCLPELLNRLQPGEAGSYRKPGFWMAPDFDAPIDDFKEYRE